MVTYGPSSASQTTIASLPIFTLTMLPVTGAVTPTVTRDQLIASRVQWENAYASGSISYSQYLAIFDAYVAFYADLTNQTLLNAYNAILTQYGFTTLTGGGGSTGGGTTTPVAGTYQYNQGTIVTLTATPVPSGGQNYRFTNWIINGFSDSMNPKTITMNVNTTVQAFFTVVTEAPDPSAIPSALTISAPANVTTGAPFTVSGKLTRTDTNAGISGQTITFRYGATPAGSTTTNTTGNYSSSVTIATPGTFTLKSSFAGATGLGGSYSETVVGASMGEVNWLPIIGVGIGFSVVGLAIYWFTRKRRKR